ncbi:M13 family metallopeptidase [Nesterenkonia halobia]|uniref:M13 family metallopeptidase n=1 Tax=Nesterenkonia halobia TaxID=37922 RepID=A0ABP6R948_9MICC
MTDTASADTASTPFPHRAPEVRPQDDLQRHVNGGWLKTAEIPADLDAYGSFLELRDKSEADVRAILEEAAAGTTGDAEGAELADAADAEETAAIRARIGDFYAAFMDAEAAERRGLDPIADMLAELQAVATPAELVRLSASWQRFGVDGLFAAGALRDAGDPARMLWHVMQDGLGLPDESYYRDESFAEILTQYREHLGRLLALSGVRDAEQAAADVVALETEIASHHWDRVTTRDAQKRYNLRSREEAVEAMPLLAEALDGWGLDAEKTAELVLAQPDVLDAMQTALTEQPLAHWKLWLRAQLLRWAAPLLHSAMVEEHFSFYAQVLSGAQQLKERWKRGVALTNAHLGEDVARLYVARHYPAESKVAMDELIDALVAAYRRSISTLEWMGEETRQKALEKLGTFRPMVGRPERWIDYGDVAVEPDDVVGNVRRAAAAEWDRDAAKIVDGPDPDEWHMTPQTVNAYYHPMENVICFPAAILQPPFFDPQRPMAANFGAIGAVIGHEIGHGFDDQGSRYGADGSLTDWWTEGDREAFEQRTAALVEQYSALSPSAAPEHTVNGELTLGENIGDLGGLGIAHQAYRLWREELADAERAAQEGRRLVAGAEAVPEPADGEESRIADQLFFFSWAQAWRNLTRPERAVTLISIDPHSPAEIRANQVPKNLDAFHEAFGTTAGDGMHLPAEERVAIW